MLGQLAGNESSANAFRGAMGKTISELWLGEEDDALHFRFTDDSNLRLFDDGQSCCESRYMRTDDSLADFVGAVLLGAEVRDGPTLEDEWGEHETQFLIVKTSEGEFTMTSHNEHNGYYGGFLIRAVAE
jgi:hypothetical protein